MKVARTIRKYRDGVLAAIDFGLSNGRLTGLNNKIGMLKYRAYGFHSATALIAMIFLCCSNLSLELPIWKGRRASKRLVPLALLWRLVSNGSGNAMSGANVLQPTDLDVQVKLPDGLVRIVNQNLVDLTPWHVMPRDLAVKRLQGLRQRYSRKYVPFARRQDNDDLACIDPERPEEIVIVHDFASEGTELRQRFDSFWDWFRATIEEMINFE